MTAPREAVPAPAAIDRPLRLAVIADPNSIHTRRWVGFFARRGHDVHLLVAVGQAVEPGLDPAVTVDRFVSYGRRFRPPGALRARRSLRKVLDRIRPDVLHAHAVTRHGWLAWLSGFRPLVTTAWGTDVLVTARTSRTAKLLARLVLRRSDLVTAVSAGLGRAAVEAGANPERLRIVHFGVDPERFRPGPRSPELVRTLGLDGCRVVFSARSATPIYRQDVVLEAVAGIGSEVALIVSARGAAPETLEALRARAEELGMGERMRWLESIDHEAMADYYRLADVVVSVPESDAFAVTLVEAMASGVPLVVSDLPSAREHLADEPGMLVPVGDVEATRAAIGRMFELAPDERAALGARLRAKALEFGDAARNLGAMENEYRRLIEQVRAG